MDRGRPTPPLSGFVVVDLSTGIPGGYCSKLLADGGADVLKVEAPEGDPLRRWSASGAHIGPGEDSALFGFLAGGKQSVVADPDAADDLRLVDELLASADAVDAVQVRWYDDLDDGQAGHRQREHETAADQQQHHDPRRHLTLRPGQILADQLRVGG